MVTSAIFLLLGVALDCSPTEARIVGRSLEPLLQNGDKVALHWAGCRGAGDQDFLVFTWPGKRRPIVKKIVGRPGDILRVSDDGKVFVNGNEIRRINGRSLVVGTDYPTLRFQPEVLSGFWVIGAPGSFDSFRIGSIPKDRVVGFASLKCDFCR